MHFPIISSNFARASIAAEESEFTAEKQWEIYLNSGTFTLLSVWFESSMAYLLFVQTLAKLSNFLKELAEYDTIFRSSLIFVKQNAKYDKIQKTWRNHSLGRRL